MKDRSIPGLKRRFAIFATASAAFSFFVGVSGLVGWKFHIVGLTTWGAAPVTMKANTSLGFLLMGMSLWFLRKREISSLARTSTLIGKAAAGVISLMGLLTLSELLLHLDLGIDRFLLYSSVAIQGDSPRPGMMSPITAGAQVLIGLALLGIDWRTRRGRWPAQWLALTAGGGATFGLLTFAFDPLIYASHLSLALPTSITFILFALGLICARTEWGLGALLCRQSLGGTLARRLLPAAIIPVAVGWTRWQISALGLFSEWSIVVIASLTTILLLAGLIAWVSAAVDRSEVERRRVEEALHVSEDQLNRILGRIDEGPGEASLRRKVSLGFVAAVLLTVLIGVSSWRGTRRAEQDAFWVSHTHEVMETIQRTSRHSIEAVTSARAFGLTGEESLLGHYQAARDALVVDQNALRHLTADNVSQQRRLNLLEPEVRAALELSENIITKRRKLPVYPGAGDALETERLLDIVRVGTREMYTEEKRLLIQRTERAQSGQALARVIAVIGIFIGLGLWVLAKLAVNREINISARARTQLGHLNAELEQRVEQRTAALQAEVTERKRAEADGTKLQATLREQAQVLDLAQVMVRDTTGRIMQWTRGSEKIYGYTREEAEGRLSHELLHTEFPEPLAQIEEKLMSAGTWEGELVHRKRDGSQVAVASVWVLHRDAQGRVVRVLESNTDVTEQKQVKEKLAVQAGVLVQQAEELAGSRDALEAQSLMLQSVLDSMSEGLVAGDEQGKFIIWNPAAAKILGLGATNLPSEKWTAHYGLYLEDMETPFPPDQIPMVRAIRGEASTSQMFVRNPHVMEGSWIEASGNPLKDKSGTVRGGVVAFRDITQRKADEREIRKLNEELEMRVAQRTAQLEAANHELEAFTYSVSHDLRAPLRHIGGFSKILSEDFGPGLPPEAQTHLKRIEDGAHRMGLLVDELLNLARVGRHALQLQSTPLKPIVDDVVCLLQPEINGRNVIWKIADLSPVECDAILVKQVFQNLIANALKFTRTRNPAIIEISQRQENGETVFAVSDNGVGFNMKYKDKLFGVFQRLHRAEEFEGTGIGLATVQRIVRKHGGRVWAEAELDKGATFFFTLATAESLPPKPEAMDQDQKQTVETTVLEDETKSAAAGADL